MSVYIVNHDIRYDDNDNRPAWNRSEYFAEEVGYFETTEEAQAFIDGLWEIYLAQRKEVFDADHVRARHAHNARKSAIEQKQARWDVLDAAGLAEGERPADWKPYSGHRKFDPEAERKWCDDSFEITEIKRHGEGQ